MTVRTGAGGVAERTEPVVAERAAATRLAPTILLVEDDAGDALLVEELLAESGLDARIRWVGSLAEALKALTADLDQCVLLDLHLPDAQGLSGLAAILDHAPAAAVVVLTGLVEQQVGLAAVAAGAQDYLIKGRVDAELFGRAIRYAVQRKQAEQAATALQAERLRAEENARLERGLLPVPLLVSAPVEVIARYRPGRASALVGGDFYDVVEADDGAVHALIGDVAGHGPDEAALGVLLRIAWRTLVLSGLSGPTLLHQMGRILRAERSHAGVFATVCTVVLDPDRRTVRVLRAGHPGVLVRTAGRVELAEPASGPALGLLAEGSHWPEGRLELAPGGALVLFTDGLYEVKVDGFGARRLGEEGLLTLAREAANESGERFLDTVIAKVEALNAASDGMADDIAVVHLSWKETG
jgi:serine phosphatase RsbU (regulator of sigma subunit)